MTASFLLRLIPVDAASYERGGGDITSKVVVLFRQEDLEMVGQGQSRVIRSDQLHWGGIVTHCMREGSRVAAIPRLNDWP